MKGDRHLVSFKGLWMGALGKRGVPPPRGRGRRGQKKNGCVDGGEIHGPRKANWKKLRKNFRKGCLKPVTQGGSVGG